MLICPPPSPKVRELTNESPPATVNLANCCAGDELEKVEATVPGLTLPTPTLPVVVKLVAVVVASVLVPTTLNLLPTYDVVVVELEALRLVVNISVKILVNARSVVVKKLVEVPLVLSKEVTKIFVEVALEAFKLVVEALVMVAFTAEKVLVAVKFPYVALPAVMLATFNESAVNLVTVVVASVVVPTTDVDPVIF